VAAAVALVQLEQQEERAAVTVALVRHICQPFMRVAAGLVAYLMRMETVREDLAVAVMVVAEREPMVSAAEAAARLQIFQVRQVHQGQEKAAMALLSFVTQARPLDRSLRARTASTRQHRRVVTPSILSSNPETW